MGASLTRHLPDGASPAPARWFHSCEAGRLWWHGGGSGVGEKAIPVRFRLPPPSRLLRAVYARLATLEVPFLRESARVGNRTLSPFTSVFASVGWEARGDQLCLKVCLELLLSECSIHSWQVSLTALYRAVSVRGIIALMAVHSRTRPSRRRNRRVPDAARRSGGGLAGSREGASGLAAARGLADAPTQRKPEGIGDFQKQVR